MTTTTGEFTLPGVRKTSLFEIKRKSGLDDDSDIDVHEDEKKARRSSWPPPPALRASRPTAC